VHEWFDAWWEVCNRVLGGFWWRKQWT
jgi:hypothetical protein